jgi:hypothetical protein
VQSLSKAVNKYAHATRTKKLISIRKALELWQDPEWMKMKVTSQPIALTEEEKEAFHFLSKHWRNEMEHSIPGMHEFGLIGIPEAAENMVNIITRLVRDTHTYARGELEPWQMERIPTLVNACIGHLRNHPIVRPILRELLVETRKLEP